MRAAGSKLGTWAALGAAVMSMTCAGATRAEPVFVSGEGTPAASSDAGSGFDNLEVVDSRLNGKVAVLRVGSEVGQNNLLSVFAGLKNKTGRRLDLEIETIYQDKDNNALNAGSWIAFTLKPYEEKEYRSASISEEAVDFLIRVRRPPAGSASTGK